MIRKIACLETIGLIFSGIAVLAADSKKEAAAARLTLRSSPSDVPRGSALAFG
jgi:hypothetical protein